MKLKAPWSPTQVEAITAFQRRDDVHPFTCQEHSDAPLQACETHLYCPDPRCDYRQTWVHDWMAGTKR